MKNNRSPKISIITVTYNAESVLEETMLSVINQTYNNIEYIIIDGGSTDGTIDIIKKYEDKISYWISEPDKGIYDAMNKGIDKAKGDWINFMNAGDSFYDKDIIKKIHKQLVSVKADIFYGGVKHIMPYGTKLLNPLPPRSLLYNMPCSHQAIFIKKNIQKKFPYNIKFKIAADYNLFYNLYKKGYIFELIPLCIANSEGTGESYINKCITMKEVLLINGSYNKFYPRFKYELKKIFFKLKLDKISYKLIGKLMKYR